MGGRLDEEELRASGMDARDGPSERRLSGREGKEGPCSEPVQGPGPGP